MIINNTQGSLSSSCLSSYSVISMPLAVSRPAADELDALRGITAADILANLQNTAAKIQSSTHSTSSEAGTTGMNSMSLSMITS